MAVRKDPLTHGIDFIQRVLGYSEEHLGMLCGLDASGKTTLLFRWKLGEVVNTIPTVGFNLETIPHGQRWNLTLWDVGGGEKLRMMMRHYLSEDRFIIFVHDCVDQNRLDEQLEHFHNCAKKLHEVGARYMWVVFNKQDQLPTEKRDSIVQDLMPRYEAAADRYSDSLMVRVLDLPGLSAREGTQVHAILDDIKQTLQAQPRLEPKALPSADAPSRWNLVEKAEEMISADDTTPEEFGLLLESGKLLTLDHYNFLKAGYYVMLDGITFGRSILDSAEVFMGHLKRLRVVPGTGLDHSRLVSNRQVRDTLVPTPAMLMRRRTMAVFWLSQLQVAATNYVNARSEGRPPSRDAFKDVLLYNPELVKPFLWNDYYSTDHISTPEARQRWCAPDLKAFPSVVGGPRLHSQPRKPINSDGDRLITFALAVAQKILRSKLTRGEVVTQALAALQSSIIRQRVVQPSIPPFSETRAYFWIQLVHTALVSPEVKQPPKEAPLTDWKVMVQTLTPGAFKALYRITGEDWREYYTESLWNSVAARIACKKPDRKSLPAAFPVPALANVQRARAELAHDLGLSDGDAELPSADDLQLMSAVIIDEAELVELEGPDGTITRSDSHARRLLRLYRELARDAVQLITKAGGSSELALGIAASGADLPGYDFGCRTKSFWAQRLVVAMGEAPEASFEELITANPHLAYEQLPLVYFSSLLVTREDYL